MGARVAVPGEVDTHFLINAASRQMHFDAFRELVHRSVQVKLALVEQDELDTGVRRHLNYGHTLGRASLSEETRRHLRQVGLPTVLPMSVRFEQVRALMAQDKKAGIPGRESVPCERPGTVRLSSLPDEDFARRGFETIRAPQPRGAL